MRPNPYIVQILKYATLTLLVCAGILASIVLLRSMETTLPLAGRLVTSQQRGVIPTVRFDEARAIDGFSAPADTHVFFTVPQGTRMTRVAFLGGPDFDLERYWGYCPDGTEDENKAKGLRGKKMYTGQFFYSLGERKAQVSESKAADDDILGLLDETNREPKKAPASIAEIFYGGQLCYLMSSVILPVAVDSDGDELNNKREQSFGTNPNNPDTDGDGIPDGMEVFTTKTNPLLADTDRDGLSDSCEDNNKNGTMEKDETSPLVADTDRDGLCDGNGLGLGCPEPRRMGCAVDAPGTSGCAVRLTSPVKGEDMNQNCVVDEDETDPRKAETFGIPDWQYKWQKLQTQLGNRKTVSSSSSSSVTIPIPLQPQGN